MYSQNSTDIISVNRKCIVKISNDFNLSKVYLKLKIQCVFEICLI